MSILNDPQSLKAEERGKNFKNKGKKTDILKSELVHLQKLKEGI